MYNYIEVENVVQLEKVHRPTPFEKRNRFLCPHFLIPFSKLINQSRWNCGYLDLNNSIVFINVCLVPSGTNIFNHFQHCFVTLCYPNLSKNAYISWAIWILYLFHCSPSGPPPTFSGQSFLLKVNHNLWFRLWHEKNCRLTTSCTTICSQGEKPI